MNWYKIIKIASPIPDAEDYPVPYGDKEYPESNRLNTVRYNITII